MYTTEILKFITHWQNWITILNTIIIKKNILTYRSGAASKCERYGCEFNSHSFLMEMHYYNYYFAVLRQNLLNTQCVEFSGKVEMAVNSVYRYTQLVTLYPTM